MNKLKYLLFGIALLSPLMAFADGKTWLTFSMKDNTELSVASENLNIDYNNKMLVLTSASVNQSISIDQVKSMRFTTSPAGINEVIGDLASGEIDFYNVTGTKAGRFTSVDEAKKNLPSGIYILNNGEKSLKIIF